MKKCKACNQGIPDEAKKCPFCGKPAGGFWNTLFEGGETRPPAAQRPTPVGSENDPFALTIQDVFSIPGRGTVVIGVIRSGSIRTGEMVRFMTPAKQEKVCTVTGIEMFRKEVQAAKAGDTVGLLLGGANKGDAAKGIGLTKIDPSQE
jgi:translation elongation factor EF-Tu-like GTPase